jgi:hypothetical protein
MDYDTQSQWGEIEQQAEVESTKPYYLQPLVQRFGLIDFEVQATKASIDSLQHGLARSPSDYRHSSLNVYVRDGLTQVRAQPEFIEWLKDNHSDKFREVDYELMQLGLGMPLDTVSKTDVLKSLQTYTRAGLDCSVDVFAYPLSSDLYRIYAGNIETRKKYEKASYSDLERATAIRGATKILSEQATSWRKYVTNKAKLCDVFLPFDIAKTRLDSLESYEGTTVGTPYLNELNLDEHFKQWVVLPTVMYNPKRPFGIPANFKFAHLGHYIIGEPRSNLATWDKYVRTAKVNPNAKRPKDPILHLDKEPISVTMPKYESPYDANTVEAVSVSPLLARVGREVEKLLR